MTLELKAKAKKASIYSWYMIKASANFYNFHPTYFLLALNDLFHWSVFIRKHFRHLTVTATNNSGNSTYSLYGLYYLNDITLMTVFVNYVAPLYAPLSYVTARNSDELWTYRLYR